MRFSLAFQPHSSNLFRPVLMLAIKIHVCRLNYTLALRVHAQLSHFYARFSNPNIWNYRLMITRLKGYNFVMFRVYKFSPPKKKKNREIENFFSFLSFFFIYRYTPSFNRTQFSRTRSHLATADKRTTDEKSHGP